MSELLLRDPKDPRDADDYIQTWLIPEGLWACDKDINWDIVPAVKVLQMACEDSTYDAAHRNRAKQIVDMLKHMVTVLEFTSTLSRDASWDVIDGKLTAKYRDTKESITIPETPYT